MKEWSTACPDWERRIVAGQSLIAFPPLFPVQAAEALEYFGSLRMVDATGSPLMSEAVRPWVTEFVAAIFGAYDESCGRRMINEALLCISKKNGKSTIAAGIMLTALLLNWRTSGEFIILAPTKEVADNSYKPIRDMIFADDELKARFKVQEYFRLVTDTENGAALKVVAADSDTVSGKKAIGVFIDELHEFGKQAKAANMLLEATGGLTSRPEGFVIYATTQSEEPPAGVFAEKLKYARAVRDGTIEDRSFLPVLYEFPPAMIEAGEHKKLENAYVTNPNWGLSVDVPYIEKKYQQALAEGDKGLRLFLAKHLNVEIGVALGSNAWAGAKFWERQAAPQRCSLEAILRNCEVVEVGIDGGGLDDLLGFCVMGRCRETGHWLAWFHAWAHPEVLERRKEVAPRLKDFEADGDLTMVERVDDDVDQAVAIVMRCEAAGLLDKIGVDAVGIGKIFDALIESDIEADRIKAIGQGWQMNGSIKDCERALAGRTLWHHGSRLMNWCVSNARIEQTGNAVKVTKQVSGTAKIDPLIGLFNAASLLARAPAALVATEADEPVFA